jgi:hypothetical protein
MRRDRHVESNLVDFLRDQLSAEERREVEAHLSHCPRCRVEAEALRKSFEDFRLAETPALPESYLANFLPRLHQRISEREDRRSSVAKVVSSPWFERFLIPTAALATAVLVILQIRIVPVVDGPNSEPFGSDPQGRRLRQIVAQMDVEELQSAAMLAAPKLLPEPLNRSDVILASEEATRTVVDSLFAFGSDEVERVVRTSLLEQNDMNLGSLSNDEVNTVLARLEVSDISK